MMSPGDMAGLAIAIRSGLAEEDMSLQDQYAVLTMTLAMIAAEHCGPDPDRIRVQLDAVASALNRIQLDGPDENGYYAIGMPPRPKPGGLQ